MIADMILIEVAPVLQNIAHSIFIVARLWDLTPSIIKGSRL